MENKVDLSSLAGTPEEFDAETGHKLTDFDHEPLTPAQLREALERFADVLGGFIGDFNMVMDQMGARVAALEVMASKQSQIMHMLARRSDWFMEGKEELAATERQLMKEDAEKIKAHLENQKNVQKKV